MTKLNQDAIDNLRNNQQQLDQDGVIVGVSRQALDEVLAYIDAMRDTVILECARIAKQHRPPRPPANRYVFASEELQNTIRDESRGEEIAAEEIYKAIISLKSSAHILYEQDDTDAPSCIKDSNGDIVLGLCRVCNAGEIELEEPCIPKW